MTVVTKYLEIRDEYQKIYGEKYTVVLMQVGSFYELYAHTSDYDWLHNLAKILNMRITKKDKSKSFSPYLVGFPCYTLQKQLRLLIEHGNTVVVVDQHDSKDKRKSTMDREVACVYSKGTIIPDTPLGNNIVSIHINRRTYLGRSRIIAVGVSSCDISTGEVHMMENTSHDNGDIIRFLTCYSPSELIISSEVSKPDDEIEEFLSQIGVEYSFCTFIDRTTKLSSISYQKEIIEKAYTGESSSIILEYIDTGTTPLAKRSLLILLDFVLCHDDIIAGSFQYPQIFLKTKYAHLGNNASYQLNILPEHFNKYTCARVKYSSLLDVVDKTATPMGKRFIRYALSNPLTDASELKHRYQAINNLIEVDAMKKISKYLSEIGDIERVHLKFKKQISLKSIHHQQKYTINPSVLYLHLSSYSAISKILKFIDKHDKIGQVTTPTDFQQSDIIDALTALPNLDGSLRDAFEKYKKECYNTFIVDKLHLYSLDDISENIFHVGLFPEIDKKSDEIKFVQDDLLPRIISTLNTCLPEKDRKLKIQYHEELGHFIPMTKRRGEIISAKIGDVSDILAFDSIQKDSKGSSPKWFLKKSHPSLNDYHKNIQELRHSLVEQYAKKLHQLYIAYSDMFQVLHRCIAVFDFLMSGAISAIELNYCRPTIKKTKDSESYIKTKELRHPIVEQIQKSTKNKYVPVDVSIGKNSILLFGLNSCGKSTLMKATGLSVILAQAGLYVPATTFRFFPFKSIFTRITGSDNMFKGLSTFSLEMLELGSIINDQGPSTLVLCDELASGTEHESAKIITLSMLQMMTDTKTRFINATHLHEILPIPRFKTFSGVKCKHLYIECDDKSNKLIYHREIRDGPGKSVYGYKVAKFIINIKSFSSLIDDIASEISDKTSIIDKKTSRYNSSVVMSECKICHTTEHLEAHHILPQKDADIHGYIKTEKTKIHKDSADNLVVLCTKCHDLVDKTIRIRGYRETSSGQELIVEDIKDKEFLLIQKYSKSKLSFKQISKDIQKKFNIKISQTKVKEQLS
jgi:DNA mismatch repair protein MutS|uniref:DNA mismatch repair proteins mutS family domain-containing protein n=1 Tax=viral metagenome TaxID=1070528 RepID=A0A6C0IVQ3_9ZZZZ